MTGAQAEDKNEKDEREDYEDDDDEEEDDEEDDEDDDPKPLFEKRATLLYGDGNNGWKVRGKRFYRQISQAPLKTLDIILDLCS